VAFAGCWQRFRIRTRSSACCGRLARAAARAGCRGRRRSWRWRGLRRKSRVAGSGRVLARVMARARSTRKDAREVNRWRRLGRYGEQCVYGWDFGHNARCGHCETGRLTGCRGSGIMAEWGLGGPSRSLNDLYSRRRKGLSLHAGGDRIPGKERVSRGIALHNTPTSSRQSQHRAFPRDLRSQRQSRPLTPHP